MAMIDIRFVPKDARSVVSRLKRLIPKHAKLEIYAHEPALDVSSKDTLLKKLASSVKKVTGKSSRFRAAQGTSDARHYQRVGCAGIEFGPIGGAIGTDHEWIDIRSLKTYCEILEDFLVDLDSARLAT
jgi:acetylornithine deacetylase/succinyl-diaminopimelate desuccinylase-like protein